jgi:hypothetical protein
MSVQENQEWLEFNVTRQPLVYADGVDLLDGNVNTIKKKHRSITG